MSDLIAIMGSLVDKKGKILIPGINDTVAKVGLGVRCELGF